MSMARAAAVALLADALGIDRSVVDADTAISTTLQWDSLAHMRLILALEERLGRRLDPESIVAIAGIQDVVALLEGDA
jgi:acyl carrier protein